MPENLNDYVSGLLAHAANVNVEDTVEINHVSKDIINTQDAESVEDMLLNQSPNEFETRLLVKRMGSLAVSKC